MAASAYWGTVPGRYLTVECEGKLILELYVSIAEDQPDFYCPLDLTRQKGYEIVLRAEVVSETLA
jgi:hypothetical protein